MSDTYLDPDNVGSTINKRSYINLVELLFDTPIRITSSMRDIIYNSETYTALGQLLSIGKVRKELKINNSNTIISLSGVDQSLISAFLSENPANARVKIYGGWTAFTSSWLFVNGAPNPLLLFEGFIDNFTIQENYKNGLSTISLRCVNHWAALDRSNGRRLNNEDQQRLFTSDTGLMFAAEIIEDIRWGKIDI